MSDDQELQIFAIAAVEAAAQQCGYKLTKVKLKNRPKAMETYPLCRITFPLIMAEPDATLSHDSKQKYMRVVRQLCDAAPDNYSSDAILSAEVARLACDGQRAGSL